MKVRTVQIWGIALLFMGMSLLPMAHVSAAADDGTLNLVTSPLPINLHAAPGSTITTDLLIKNGSTHPENLKVTLMKFSAYGEQGKPSIQERGAGDDYFDWVKFSSSTFAAAPNKWVTIKMTITVPQKTAFGYYYAAVFSRADKPQKAIPGQNTLLGSSAVLILLAVDQPGANRTASVTGFSVDRHIYEYLPASFSVKIRNSGNVHLIPTGNIFITRGKTPVSTLHVNAANRNVLPASNRIFTTEWDDGFPAYVKKEAGGQVILDNHDKAVSELKWDLSKISHLRIGKYTAHLLMAYDNGKTDVPIESTLTFWIIPWRLVLAAIAIPVIPAVLVYFWSNWRFKRRLVKHEAQTTTQHNGPDTMPGGKPAKKP
jgi:hypothetical protein